MAPEQIETPGEVDQRADIYSLGVVLYELLTRELPLGRFAPPSERSPMDPRIDEIVMRALEKDRNARYQNVGEVKTGVAAITGSHAGDAPPGSPPPSVPPSPVPLPAAGAQEPPSPEIRWKAALIFAIINTIGAIIVEVLALSGEDQGMTVAALVFLPTVILGIVFFCILHYQCWNAIPGPLRAITPGSAVGFLFIPLFNFYWAFVSWPKLGEGLADWQRSRGDHPTTAAHGLGITYGILFVLSWTLGLIPGLGSLIGIASLVIFFLFYRSVVATLNRLNGHS
jgi:hypothetical protein